MSNSKLSEHVRSVKRKNEAREAMQKLIDITNVMGGDKDVAAGILEGLLTSHKTLQQSFMRCFVEAMKEYADTRFVDLRNQASVDFAQQLKEMDIHFPFV